jgi:hypothetical protein
MGDANVGTTNSFFYFCNQGSNLKERAAEGDQDEEAQIEDEPLTYPGRLPALGDTDSRIQKGDPSDQQGQHHHLLLAVAFVGSHDAFRLTQATPPPGALRPQIRRVGV